MLNLCIFIFIVYAVSYSAKVILFGTKRQQRRKSYSVATSAHKTTRQNTSKRKNNVILINTKQSKKTGRKGKLPKRPFLFIIFNYNPRIEVAIAK